MLTILECNPSGCFSYGLHRTIEFPSNEIIELTGCNHDRLTNTSNGSGKSSLLNSLCHILYGEDPSGASDTEVANSVWNKGCWGYVKYCAPNRSTYRIVMARRWTQEVPDPNFKKEVTNAIPYYTGTDIYFDEWVTNQWVDRRQTKMAETRQAILKTLGMSYSQFLTTSYLAQQKTAQFVTGKNKDRMSIISEMMDLSIWDKARTIASKRATALQSSVTALQSNIAGQRQALDSLTPIDDTAFIKMYQEIDRLTDLVATSVDNIRRGAVNIEAGNRDLKCAQDQLLDIKVKYETVHKICVAIGSTIQSLETNCKIEVSGAKVPSTETPLQALRLSKEVEIKILHSQLNRLMTGAGLCDRCASQVSESHIVGHRSVIASSINALECELVRIGGDITQARIYDNAALTEVRRNINERYAKLIDIERVRMLGAHNQESSLSDEMNLVESSIKAISTSVSNLVAEGAAYVAERDRALFHIEFTEKNIKYCEEMSTKRQDIVNTIVANEQRLTVLEKEMRCAQMVVKGMSDKGIKAHKFGSIIETLNALVSEYVDIVTEGQVKVWFSPWREASKAKSEDDVVAEIQIFVREGPKTAVELNLYSGAERQQITLAIVCAFWRLAGRNGTSTNILLLDEIFNMFDGPTAGLAVKLLSHLRDSHYGTIIVVTHDNVVKQSIDFDQTWTCDKINHLSTIHQAAC